MRKSPLRFLSIGLSLLLWLAAASFMPADNPDAVVGTWKTGEGTALIKIYKNGSKYEGKIVWLKEPNDPETGKPKTDKNNRNAQLRSRPLLGMVNVYGFSYDGGNEWDDGKVYDPKGGKEYSGTMTLRDANTLALRGYIGISLIGRTDVWKRQP